MDQVETFQCVTEVYMTRKRRDLIYIYIIYNRHHQMLERSPNADGVMVLSGPRPDSDKSRISFNGAFTVK